MKAIVQHEYGSPEVLKLRELPVPVVRDGEVLVRVHSASVQAGDWHFLNGLPGVARLLRSGCFDPGERFRDSMSPGGSRGSARMWSSSNPAMRCSAHPTERSRNM